MFLDRGFQGLNCLVRPLAQFRCHDSGEVELGMLRGVFLLELLQFGQGVLLLAQPGEGDDPVLLGGDGFRVLSDHDLKIIECLLILSQTEVRHGPSQPGIKVVGLGLELLLRISRSALARSRAGRGWLAPLTARSRSNWSPSSAACFCSNVSLELVAIDLTRDGGFRGSSPDAAISRATVGPDHGVQGPGDQLRVLELVLELQSGSSAVVPTYNRASSSPDFSTQRAA